MESPLLLHCGAHTGQSGQFLLSLQCQVSVPTGSPRKGPVCQDCQGREGSWALRADVNLHNKVKAESARELLCTSQPVGPGQVPRSDTFLPSPGRSSATSSACSLLHSPTQPHKELQLGNMCSADSRAQLKMQALEKLKKQVFAVQTCCGKLSNSSRNMAHNFKKQIWGRYQTDKYCSLGWLESSLGHSLSMEMVPKTECSTEELAHNKLLGITAL